MQEDFIATGEETLDKLDDYIRQCDAVVHLVGDMTGASAQAPSVALIRSRYPDFTSRLPVLEPFLEPNGPALSYTQWEAWLALYHRKMLIIAVPQDGAPRDETYRLVDGQREAQQAHLSLLARVERYPEIRFANADRLVVELLRSRLHDILPPLQIASETLERLREVASSLLEVGRATWKMPQFFAPLNLEAQEENADSELRPTSIAALTEAVTMGANLMLFGEGGIGKTTFLLELSGALLAEKCPRIPLYIDAAYWALTNTQILDYIAYTPAAQRHGVTVSELVKLADAGCLTLAVNGWNEVPGAQKLGCLGRFGQLSTMIPTLNVVVVTRSVKDAPNLKAGRQVHVRGLTWQGQLKVIRSELDEDPAKALIELLARDTRLRHAARSPLILKGLLAQAKKGEVASSSVFDLLGAVIAAFEEDDQRRLLHEGPPLRSQHRYFLEALAYHLTFQQETTTSRQEALPVISVAAGQLVACGNLGSLPEPSEVLDALSNHHLIHADEQAVRFAHQRFQEYFAATRLFRVCVDGGEDDIALFREAVNQPFWEDALRLVGVKLKGAEGSAQTRSRLVRAALGVDLGFACDLAGACALSDVDDSDLYRDLVTRVNVLCESPLVEVADYGVVCLIASGFTVFADRLWPLLESDNQNTRLNTYRVNGEGISFKQLGDAAETRIAAWSPARRAELMHELADNPDNYDFLVRAANEAVEDEVRAAAIAALAWSFPASEAPLQAWLKAPADVQLEHNVISVVEYALEQGTASDAVRERLKVLALENSTESLQLKLALAFPDEAGVNAVEAVLARLREIDRHSNDAQLVAFAMKRAPDRLEALARELVLSARVIPDWVCKVVQQESDEARTEVFENAWSILHGEEAQHLSAEAVGPLASRWQTLRSVREWLDYCQNRRGNLSEAERERGRQLGYLLANAPGDDLLSVIMELGENSPYDEATELLDLVRSRIRRDAGRSSEKSQLLPSMDAVRALIALFGKQSIDEVVPQHQVHVLLCCIASHVAPAEFGDLLLEGCRLHLDSWGMYYTARDEWSKTRSGHQPSNPYWGNYLTSALENWGFEALPGLLELLGHPHANALIPGAIVRIVSRPWAVKKEGPFQNIGTDFKEGEERRLAGRVLLQPDDTHQELTDTVARALGTKLIEQVNQLRMEQTAAGAKWNANHAVYRMSGLLNAVANTPSPEIVEPLRHALANGFTDVYSAVGALKGLIRQGAFIDDAAVVTRIEALYEEEATVKWFDQQKRYVMAELCQLMYFVRPASLLSKPLSDYLIEWQRFAHINEVIRHLGAIPSEDSWCCLLALGRSSAAKGTSPEELVFALASALSPDHFTEFLQVVADGTWFAWCQNGWNLQRIAPDIFRVIGDDAARLDVFLEACELSGSPVSDRFACAVLALIPDGDAIQLRYGLAALDAGRVGDSRSSIYSMLKTMFTFHVPLGVDGHYEVHPKACNELRRHLYNRAKGNGLIATASRRLLADAECQRREGGRPTDEPRHPAEEEGIAWTEVLAIPS